MCLVAGAFGKDYWLDGKASRAKRVIIMCFTQAMKELSGKATSPLRNVFHRFEPGIWIVTIIQFFTVIGFSICMPFLSLHLYQDRGLSLTQVRIILLAAGLCSAVSQALGGALSDRFGRRPILLIAASVSIFLYSGLAVLIGISAPG